MTCGGLITIGLVLHLCTGAVEWNNFSWPLNIYILAIYVITLIVLFILRKRLYFVRWAMTYNAAVPSLIAVVLMTFVMGMIKQVPSSPVIGDVSIFNRMFPFGRLSLSIFG